MVQKEPKRAAGANGADTLQRLFDRLEAESFKRGYGAAMEDLVAFATKQGQGRPKQAAAKPARPRQAKPRRRMANGETAPLVEKFLRRNRGQSFRIDDISRQLNKAGEAVSESSVRNAVVALQARGAAERGKDRRWRVARPPRKPPGKPAREAELPFAGGQEPEPFNEPCEEPAAAAD